MPQYMYRREDGSTFTIRQKFSDDPLTVDPESGQKVVRVVQPTGVIFKGSGFYINDSKSASKSSLSSNKSSGDHGSSNGSNGKTTEGGSGTEAKTDPKPETKSEITTKKSDNS